MSELTTDRISELAIEALERTAFVLAEPGEGLDDFKPDLAASVSFTGFTNGSVVLHADRAFACELAASMMGVDEDEVTPELEGRDALNELANIVGGSIITELGGRDHDYQYGLPQTVNACDSLPEGTCATVASEEGMLAITWVKGNAAQAAA